ncbi:MAG: ABC transporter permease [Pyrobaculum sp.]
MFAEVFRLAWKALWERKGRTIGAIIGVVIAFSALSYALLLGQTFREYTTSFFTSNFGANTLFVTGSQFTDADVGVISTIPGVDVAVPLAITRGAVRVPGTNNPVPVTVYGVDPSYLPKILHSSSLYQGAMFISSNFVLVGYYVAVDRSTGQQRISAGSALSLSIGRKSSTAVVSGVLATGNIGFFDTARGVIMDLSAFRQITGITSYNVIIVLARDSSQLDSVANEIRANFPNVDVISPQAILQTINSYLTSFQLFSGMLAGVSTVITALWLYDTMSISVVQRTKEIGVMRALGFKRRHVMAMFLTEAFIIAAIGVVIGIALLIPMSQVRLSALFSGGASQAPRGGPQGGPAGGFGNFMNISQLVLDPLIIAATASLVIAVNVAGAFLPAFRGGRINIVQALRYE